jgi:hypothetical protein
MGRGNEGWEEDGFGGEPMNMTEKVNETAMERVPRREERDSKISQRLW